MFKGKWITAEDLRKNQHGWFEKRFTLNEFNAAKIRITADDYFKLYINGNFVGQGPAPSFSGNYRFCEFDIGEYLCAGENEICVHCWYQGLTNRVWVSNDSIFGLIADIIVDGQIFLCTGGDWQYRIDRSFIGGETLGYDTAFLENRDMRLGLSEPQNALEIPCPHRFAKKAFPAIQTYEISAEPIKSGGRYFYDFNQEYACTPIIKATAKADGARIILRCAEELNGDGTPRFNLRCGCDYEEEITLKKGKNRIEQYDYKALRYIEIICENAEIEELKIRVQHFPRPEKTQEIKTDDEKLKAVWRLCKNTVLLGAQEGFIDCPTREKGQYLGDAFISGFAHFYLTDDCRLLKKAICDFAASSALCDEILAVAPCSYQQKIADYSLLFAPMLLKFHRLTGDGEMLKTLLPICDKINAHYAKYENEKGLLSGVDCSWNLVDWPDNMRDGYQYNLTDDKELGKHCVINAYYVYSLKCTEEIRQILGIEGDNKSAEKAEAFNRIFFDESRGIYIDCAGGEHTAIHSNLLPLAFGLCPEERKKSVADYLETRGMECSVYMAYFYLWALCNAGRKEAALRFITADGEHSWLNMIKEGATTTFEAWGKEQKWNTSLFHPWATAPILIINEHFADMIDK